VFCLSGISTGHRSSKTLDAPLRSFPSEEADKSGNFAYPISSDAVPAKLL
jgi:hypothetical protein